MLDSRRSRPLETCPGGRIGHHPSMPHPSSPLPAPEAPSPSLPSPPPAFDASRVRAEPVPLARLLGVLPPGVEVRGDPNAPITDVVDSSADATAGSLFCCVPGERDDGHDLAGQAVRAGAVALL